MIVGKIVIAIVILGLWILLLSGSIPFLKTFFEENQKILQK